MKFGTGAFIAMGLAGGAFGAPANHQTRELSSLSQGPAPVGNPLTGLSGGKSLELDAPETLDDSLLERRDSLLQLHKKHKNHRRDLALGLQQPENAAEANVEATDTAPGSLNSSAPNSAPDRQETSNDIDEEAAAELVTFEEQQIQAEENQANGAAQ